jgi:hypothetical protein
MSHQQDGSGNFVIQRLTIVVVVVHGFGTHAGVKQRSGAEMP